MLPASYSALETMTGRRKRSNECRGIFLYACTQSEATQSKALSKEMGDDMCRLLVLAASLCAYTNTEHPAASTTDPAGINLSFNKTNARLYHY